MIDGRDDPDRNCESCRKVAPARSSSRRIRRSKSPARASRHITQRAAQQPRAPEQRAAAAWPAACFSASCSRLLLLRLLGGLRLVVSYFFLIKHHNPRLCCYDITYLNSGGCWLYSYRCWCYSMAFIIRLQARCFSQKEVVYIKTPPHVRWSSFQYKHVLEWFLHYK